MPRRREWHGMLDSAINNMLAGPQLSLLAGGVDALSRARCSTAKMVLWFAALASARWCE